MFRRIPVYLLLLLFLVIGLVIVAGCSTKLPSGGKVTTLPTIVKPTDTPDFSRPPHNVQSCTSDDDCGAGHCGYINRYCGVIPKVS